MKPKQESSNELLERINRSDRRLHRVNSLLVAIAVAALLFLTVLSIYSEFQVRDLIAEHYQRTKQIDQQFSKQFNEIEQALKEQDNYFICRLNQHGTTTDLTACTAPFTNVTLSDSTAQPANSSQPSGGSQTASTIQTASAPSSSSTTSQTSSGSSTGSSSTGTSTPPSTTNPQPTAAVAQILQDTGNAVQETTSALGNFVGSI